MRPQAEERVSGSRPRTSVRPPGVGRGGRWKGAHLGVNCTAVHADKSISSLQATARYQATDRLNSIPNRSRCADRLIVLPI